METHQEEEEEVETSTDTQQRSSVHLLAAPALRGSDVMCSLQAGERGGDLS